MSADTSQIIKRISSDRAYISMFYKAFDSEKVSMSKIRMALAQFLRSITSFDTRIDQSYKQASEYMNKGHSQAETVKYLFGFSDKTISVLSMCERCHSTITYGNIKMKNNGLDLQYQDIGLAKLTSKKEDIGVFKAPSFRNLKYTAPYMHDGRFKTLEEVIEHYNNGILPHENLDPILKDSLGNPIKLGLGELEKKTNPFVYNIVI
jgi:cytochrome c peroxidase